jgi:predicted  nucleic acid-binding Zn-ribbon protein
MSHSDDIRNTLEQIHLIQTQLNDLNGSLRRSPLLLKAQEGNIQKQKANLAQINETHQKLKAEAKQKELEVAANDQALAKRKTQLQESKSNKEYQALQLQIKADEAARSVLDDEALEAIEKAEQYAVNIPTAEAELKKAGELYETTKKKFAEDKPQIEAKIIHFQQLLESEEVKLPRDFREIYNRLVRSVGGNEALAVVENQKYCGGCNHQIPINSLAQILQKKPITCSSCARLLYVPKDFVFDKG